MNGQIQCGDIFDEKGGRYIVLERDFEMPNIIQFRCAHFVGVPDKTFNDIKTPLESQLYEMKFVGNITDL